MAPRDRLAAVCNCPEHGDEFVRWVQSALNRGQGLALPVTGVMDAATRSALRRFQEQQGLPADGIAGPDTERALLQGGAPAAADPSAPAADGTDAAAATTAEEMEWLELDDDESESEYRGGSTVLTPVPGIENTSQAFRDKVVRIAAGLGVDPNHLMAVMSFESDASFSPSKRNSLSGATGLIQFMPETAAALGTSTSALAAMTAERQLDDVQRYFEPYRGRMRTLDDVYMAVLWPKAVGQGSDYVLFSTPSKAYEQNAGLDTNKDGRITVAEATSFVRRRLGMSAPAPAPSAPGYYPPAAPSVAVNRSSREYIMWVQSALNRLRGAGLDVDGISGPMTRSAVRSFQTAEHIGVDGIVGPETEGALIRAGAGYPPGYANPGSTPVPPPPPPPTGSGAFPRSPDGTPRYRQGDPRWGGRMLGNQETISRKGCAMTATAMALSKIAKRLVTPLDLDEWLDSHHGYSGDNLYWGVAADIIGAGAASLSTLDFGRINSELGAGRPVVIAVDHSGDGKSDHYVTLTRRSAQGGSTIYHVNDPADGKEMTMRLSGSQLVGDSPTNRTYRSSGQVVIFTGGR